MLYDAAYSISNKIELYGGVRRAIIILSWMLAIGLGIRYECHLYYFPLFAAGYFIHDWMRIEKYSPNYFFLSFILLTAMAGFRVLMRHFFDGTAVYDYGVVSVCMSVISLCITIIVYEGCFLIRNSLSAITGNRIYKYLDHCNFYIYIVHYFWVPVIYEKLGYLYGTFVFAMAVYCSAIALKSADNLFRSLFVSHAKRL